MKGRKIGKEDVYARLREKERHRSVALARRLPMVSKPCLVCAAPIPEFTSRLCIEACRACASFFKRTLLSGRNYPCRQGDDNCSVIHSEKFTCRSCRFAKCIKFGMLHEPRIRNPKVKTVAVNPDCPSTSAKPFEKDEDSLFVKMEEQYRTSCKLRLLLEKEYVARHNLKQLNHPTQKLYIANFSAFCDLYKLTIKSLESLPQNVFDDFDRFSIADQVALYKNFILKFTMTEGIYYSSKYFKRSSNMFVSSLITCSDVTKLLSWNDDDVMLKNDAFRRTARAFANEYMDLFGPISKMEELTEREFYALGVLNYCDIESLNLPHEIVKSTERIRARTFEELQDYYRNVLMLDDYSQRLGNLMTLAHGAGEAGMLLNEEMRMYATMFDVHSDDRLFREFFTG